MVTVGLELLILGGLLAGNMINYPNFMNVEVFINSVSNTNSLKWVTFFPKSGKSHSRFFYRENSLKWHNCSNNYQQC